MVAGARDVGVVVWALSSRQPGQAADVVPRPWEGLSHTPAE